MGRLVTIRRVPDTRRGFCRCGCLERTAVARRTRGEVRKGQHLTYVNGAHARRLESELRWEVMDSGCWEWRGPVASRWFPNLLSPYKAVWLWSGNPEPPVGMVLDHTCENPICVRPAHLEVTTHGENVRRGARCALGREHIEQVRERAKTTPISEIGVLAEEYGVSVQTITRVVLAKGGLRRATGRAKVRPS